MDELTKEVLLQKVAELKATITEILASTAEEEIVECPCERCQGIPDC